MAVGVLISGKVFETHPPPHLPFTNLSAIQLGFNTMSIVTLGAGVVNTLELATTSEMHGCKYEGESSSVSNRIKPKKKPPPN